MREKLDALNQGYAEIVAECDAKLAAIDADRAEVAAVREEAQRHVTIKPEPAPARRKPARRSKPLGDRQEKPKVTVAAVAAQVDTALGKGEPMSREKLMSEVKKGLGKEVDRKGVGIHLDRVCEAYLVELSDGRLALPEASATTSKRNPFDVLELEEP